MPDCCNDSETYNKTGKSCKAAQQCQAGYHVPNSLPVMQASIAQQPVVFAHAALFVPAFDPSGIWRPPA